MCHALDGRLVITRTRLAYKVVAPFSSRLGLDYDTKTVFVHADGHVDADIVGGVVHEMGHVFAACKPPDTLDDEFTFFGWEAALAQHVGCLADWYKFSADYTVAIHGGVAEFGDLCSLDQRRLVRDCIGYAKRHRLLDSHERPRSIRQPT